MRSLIKFELKKMLTRRVAIVANVGMLLMLTVVMGLNVVQTKTEGNIGEILSGPTAIAHRRDVTEARAGELTPERVAADIAHYQDIGACGRNLGDRAERRSLVFQGAEGGGARGLRQAGRRPRGRQGARLPERHRARRVGPAAGRGPAPAQARGTI